MAGVSAENEQSTTRRGRDERAAVAMALAAIAMWSTVATGFKLGLRQLEPLQLLWLGSLVSLVFFAIARLVVPVPHGRRREYAIAAALGLLNPCSAWTWA